MIHPFDPRDGLIIVPAKVFGPTGDTIVRLVLDTGATVSLTNEDVLLQVGYSTVNLSQTELISALGVDRVPRLVVARIETLGFEVENFLVICHSLPPESGVDGVLGLDFLRGRKLTLDFRIGLITLE